MVENMRNWLRKYWLVCLYAMVPSAIAAAAGWLIWASFDPSWSAKLDGLPSVTGALVGPLLGLLAILFGALFNAELNRRRDDRLRESATRTLAEALAAEMHTIADGLGFLETELEAHRITGPDPTRPIRFWKPEFPVFHGNIDRLGLLGRTLDAQVIDIVHRVKEFSRYSTHASSVSMETEAGKGARKLGAEFKDLGDLLRRRANGIKPPPPRSMNGST